VAQLIVLDACVLIAFADKANRFHDDAFKILSTSDSLLVSALTAAEVMVYPLPAASGDWGDLFRDLGVAIAPIEEEDVASIAETRRNSGLKMPDVLVLWLAQSRGAGIATFDEQLMAKAQQYGVPTV
jgi:predicted nucleic acid-binding protein